MISCRRWLAAMATIDRRGRWTMKKFTLIPAVLLLAVQATRQVKVVVLSSQVQHLEGEPISVIVRVTNVGSDALGYDYCDGHVDLAVIGQQRMTPPNLWGCFGGGLGSGSGCGIDHPPMLLPGKSTDFLYLLRDYRLNSGEYILQASGKAGVRRRFVGDYRPDGPAPLYTSKFRDGDPVPGQFFDQKIRLEIRRAGPDELKTAFLPYVRDSDSLNSQVSYMARDAISEMAPPFMEKTIFEFAANPNTVSLAVRGLSRIDTDESRADLVNLFDRSTDFNIREYIANALAEMSSSDQLAFFTSLLTGPSSEREDRIRQWAVLAIGRLGGDRGVDFLSSFLNGSGTKLSPWLRSVIATALSSGKSKRAIPILIDMYSDPDALVQNNICGSLMSLTHRMWCDGSGQAARLQLTWRDWWEEHGSSTKVFGPEECIMPSEASPLNITHSARGPTF
jgi:HEAT repeat protein